MSILIRGMEMPRDCYECKVWFECFDEKPPFNMIKSVCPLVEVKKPHGRLIDADKLNIHDVSPVDGFCVMGVTEEDIGLADAVIEAEGRGMIQKGIYRHFKGGTYEAIGVAIHTETQDGLVLYKDVNNPHNIIWARPVSMWNDIVNGKKRFELIEGSET